MITLNKRNMIMMVVWVVLTSFATIPFLVEASTSEVDKMDEAVTIQPLPVKQPNKMNHTDPFTMAIIGLSLGCMMFASSEHWNYHKRKEIELQISDLASLLESTFAIDCHIESGTENDPMMREVEEIEKKRDESIRKYEMDKNEAQRVISDIENEIMRIWG